MKRGIWLLVAMALLLSLSCSLLPGSKSSDETEEPAVVETTGAGAVQEEEAVEEETSEAEEETPEESEDALSVDENSLGELDSYRSVMSWSVEKDDGTGESYSIEQVATRDPAAEHLTIVSDGETVEMIQIGTEMWMCYGDEWMMTSSEDASVDSFGDMLSTSDSWIADMENGEYDYLGKETVNDVQTRHYRTEQSASWGTFYGMLGEEGEADSGVADVWVADESDLPKIVVRFTVEVQGTIEEVAATVTLSQDVSDMNEPTVIEPPEGVAAGGLPEGVPLYPDASDLTQMGTMTMFTAAADVDTVNTFYEDAFTAAGWTVEGEPTVMEDTAMSTWTKDGQTLTLMISAGDDGSSSVIVTLEGGE